MNDIINNMGNTHKVFDIVSSEDAFVGTNNECITFVKKENNWGYEIQPLTNDELKTHNPKKPINNDYKVITPDGYKISIEEYMKSDDYHNRLENDISAFMTNEKEEELIQLFKKKKTCDCEKPWGVGTICIQCEKPIE